MIHAAVLIAIAVLLGVSVAMCLLIFIGRAVRLRHEARDAALFDEVRMAVYTLLDDPADLDAQRELNALGVRDWRRVEMRILTLVENLRGDSVRDFSAALEGRKLVELTGADLRSRRVMRRLRGAHRAGVLLLDGCLDALEGATHDRDPEVVATAIRALGLIGNPRSASVVFAAIDKGHEGLAVNALIRLCKANSDVVSPELQAPNDAVRRVAATLVGEAQLFSLGAELEPLIHDEVETVRAAAVRSMGYLGNPAHLEAIGAATHDPSTSVRREALRALGELGDPRALPWLLEGLNDTADLADVAAESAMALGPVGVQALIDTGETEGPGPVAAALMMAELRQAHA